MKKTIAILLALIMVMSFATTAFAATNDSITINNAKVGETYKIYKMLDLKVDDEENPVKYTYTVVSAWSDFFTTGAGAAYVTIDAQGYVTGISDPAALAKAAAQYAKDNSVATAQADIVAATTSVKFDGLENGYYLVTSSLGTIAMAETTPDSADVTINEKNPEDTIKKEVKEDSTDTFGETNDAQVGDTVYFKSTVTLVPGTRNVVVHDKMTEGLTFNADSIAIEGLTKDTHYTVNTTCGDGCTFEIVFKDDYLNNLGATAVLNLTYTAVLNEKAVTGPALNTQENETEITYGDAQSVTDETTTTTHKFSIFKHATGSTENLAGAVFSLKKNGVVQNLIKIDDHNYRIALTGEAGTVSQFTTVASGDIVIWGVDADTDYSLEEITPPSGYNKLAAEVPVTVEAANNTRIDIENKAGSELPSTGGVGTTLFYVFGSMMVVGAAVVLVTKKRMGAAE